MFTGIVQEVGTVRALDRHGGGATLEIAGREAVRDAVVGDSIAVNGVCVTVTALLGDADAPQGFRSDLMGETVERSGLGALVVGARVNLEPALRADTRLGGHLVQGHVDGVGRVTALQPHDAGEPSEWTAMRVAVDQGLRRYLVEKGSVTVDGTSLTVTTVDDEGFGVGLIPHTLAVTALGDRRVGDPVNLEVDVVAKYVERLLRAGVRSPYTTGGEVARAASAG